MNQDILLPTMFQYEDEHQKLIKQAMLDVGNFQNKIEQNHKRVVEDQLRNILDHIQGEYHSFLQNLDTTIRWTNKQIQVVALMNPQYFRNQMKEKNILLKINLQDGFTLEWNNTCPNQYNDDSWKRHIYDDSVNDEIYFDNLLPRRQIEQVLRDNDQYIKNELQKLLYPWVNKYLLAQTQLLDIKRSIVNLSSEREQQVMLIFAINNIELKFVAAEKEEKNELDYKILLIKLALCQENFKLYYEQYGVAIEFDRNFTERVFQEEKHFNFEKDFHDQTYEMIQNRKNLFQHKSQSYCEVCKKLITLFGQSPPNLNVIEQKMTKSFTMYPKSEDQLIKLNSNRNQFIILTFQQELISVNLFESFSQEQGIQSYCMEVPLPVLDYFVQLKTPLILLIIKAFELRKKILDLDILEKIFQDESAKIQRLTQQQNLDKQQFQIDQNQRNPPTDPPMPGYQTFNNNNPKGQSLFQRQSSLQSYPLNQNIQQQIISQDANVHDLNQIEIEELNRNINKKNSVECCSSCLIY